MDETRISEQEILSVLGNRIGASEAQRKDFAEILSMDLNALIAASRVGFPKREEIDELMQLFNKIKDSTHNLVQQIATLNQKENEDSFSGAIMRISERKMQKPILVRNERPFADLTAYIASIENMVENPRFKNSGQGRDARLAKESAYTIASHYYHCFGKYPSISGTGGRDDGSEKSTYYQKLCDLLGKKLQIVIGISSQKQAISQLKKNLENADSDNSFYPFFRWSEIDK